MWESHSCACTRNAIAIIFAKVVNCLKVSPSSGSSLKDTKYAIFARVLTLNELVRQMIMWMIYMSVLRVP
jgi:hypothetical protein